jgi:hypothetical protein
VVRIFASSTVSVSSGGGTLSQLDTTPEFYCCRVPFLVPPGLLTANPAACDHTSLPVLGDPVVLIDDVALLAHLDTFQVLNGRRFAHVNARSPFGELCKIPVGAIEPQPIFQARSIDFQLQCCCHS